MTTILYSHADCLAHDTGYSHPESAARLRALLTRLDDAEFDALDRRQAPAAERGQISRVHAARYIAKVFDAVKSTEPAHIAPDTIVARSSTSAFMRAAGAICAAVDAVIAGEARNAFCAVRPPGHHATPASTMGFCVFNNVAIGVEQARKQHGLRRVAVVDFDVHHGNGTQTVYRADPDVMVASIHPAMIFNVPILRNAPAAQFRNTFETGIVPRLKDFRPELILLSAGFDAHLSDPLADQKLAPSDFTWLTEQLMAVADSSCGGRLVSVLEGGYNPSAVAQSGAAHVRALMHH